MSLNRATAQCTEGRWFRNNLRDEGRGTGRALGLNRPALVTAPRRTERPSRVALRSAGAVGMGYGTYVPHHEQCN